ncbi:hypothetical protein HMEPL2_29150 [Vreelandella aquamarina]|jgi:hypothetical protein|uniref:Uncharacterized protein n=1 Tax=Vreelandella aquamarina TaxID=77097 RepID=A0A6F8XFM8_9GAMM|nr:hypothetical protein HMEPL2_29150 [Halomonas meridiana]
MSVSHKKINGLIEQVITQDLKLDYDQTLFIDLCQRIYLIESSVDEKARSQVLSDIRDEIIRRAEKLSEKKREIDLS